MLVKWEKAQMVSAIQVSSGSTQMVCMKCRTMQDSSASTKKNELVCARGHRLRTLGHLQLRLKFMAPFGFLAHLGAILLPLLLLIRFGYGQYLELIFWTVYGVSLYLGLIGLVKSRLIHGRSISGNIVFSEYRLRFYEGWLYSTATILILLVFGLAVESFSRSHAFIMQG